MDIQTNNNFLLLLWLLLIELLTGHYILCRTVYTDNSVFMNIYKDPGGKFSDTTVLYQVVNKVYYP